MWAHSQVCATFCSRWRKPTCNYEEYRLGGFTFPLWLLLRSFSEFRRYVFSCKSPFTDYCDLGLLRQQDGAGLLSRWRPCFGLLSRLWPLVLLKTCLWPLVSLKTGLWPLGLLKTYLWPLVPLKTCLWPLVPLKTCLWPLVPLKACLWPFVPLKTRHSGT